MVTYNFFFFLDEHWSSFIIFYFSLLVFGVLEAQNSREMAPDPCTLRIITLPPSHIVVYGYTIHLEPLVFKS